MRSIFPKRIERCWNFLPRSRDPRARFTHLSRLFAFDCASPRRWPDCRWNGIMLTNLMVTAKSYYAFYGKYFSDQWTNLNPVRYGLLLIGVAFFGWLLMK